MMKIFCGTYRFHVNTVRRFTIWYKALHFQTSLRATEKSGPPLIVEALVRDSIT